MKTELRQEYFKLIDKNIISEYDVDNLCLQTLCQLETAEAIEQGLQAKAREFREHGTETRI